MDHVRPHITLADWNRYVHPLTPEEIEALTPEQCAKAREVQRQAVFGVNYKTDADGNPIETAMSLEGHGKANHLAGLERERRMKQQALEDLLGSIKPPPTGA